MNIGLVHVMLLAVRTGLSCSWKQLFAAGSAMKVKQKSFKQNVRIECLQHSSMTQLGLLVSCDNVLKFDWCCAAAVTVGTCASCQVASFTAGEEGHKRPSVN